MKLDHGPAKKVEKTGGDGRMATQALIHDQNAWLDVHDAVLLRRVKEPIPEKRQVTIGRCYSRRARG